MAGSGASCPRLLLARYYFHVHAAAIGQPPPLHQKMRLTVHRDPVFNYLLPHVKTNIDEQHCPPLVSGPH
jgi:hypothetical protein